MTSLALLLMLLAFLLNPVVPSVEDSRVRSANALAAVYNWGDQWNHTLQVFNGMRDTDLVSFNMALGACRRSSDVAELVSLMRKKQLQQDAVGTNAALSSFVTMTRWREPLELVESMRSEGIPTELATSSAITSACQRAGQWQKALIAVRLDDALDPEVLAVAITAAEGLGRIASQDLIQELQQLSHGLLTSAFGKKTTCDTFVCYMEPLDEWRHVEKGLVSSKKRAWSLAKPSEGTDAWVARLWSRMDRDRNGFMTRKELDCEEFHNIVRAAVAPQSGLSTGGASYSRTQVNVDGAIEMCLRKADVNKDNKLSFKEFRSLMRCLREPRLARYSANLAFALFDLDGNHYISKDEFRELYAFLLGHLPSLDDFEKEWNELCQPNPLNGANGELADQRSYIRWLQASDNPVIRQQAPECQPHSAAPKATAIPTSPTSSGIGGNLDLSQSRPRWNQRFNCGVNPGHVNDSRPAGLREYFSRQQSMPELKRFWEAHDGSTFRRHLEAHYSPPASAPPCKLFPKSLSGVGGGAPLLPQRHSPAGSMRDLLSGETVAWHDYWTPPARYRRPFHLQDRPLLPFETFGDVVDSSKIDSSPSTLRRHNKMLDARLRRRQKLGGPHRKCLLEAEPW